MKRIIIIDEAALFREYLKTKLEEQGAVVICGRGVTDGIAKMRAASPDLIIMDYNLRRGGAGEVLEAKRGDPNAAGAPVIITAPRMERRRVIELAEYGVKKVFTKPVRLDALFVAVSELLGFPLSVDESPGMVDVQVHENIVFVEIARALNRDKLDLLRYKLMDMITRRGIRVPKVIVMLSGIRLDFADAVNMHKLMEAVIRGSRARMNNIKVLTRDDFARLFIAGCKEYTGIEVASDLKHALNGLLKEGSGGADRGCVHGAIMGGGCLKAGAPLGGGNMDLRFEADIRAVSPGEAEEMTRGLTIAAIDGDEATRNIIARTLGKRGATVRAFAGGEAFIHAAENEDFDLAFLDLMMPDKDGFEVLKALQIRDARCPVIAVSQTTHRETIIRAFNMGIKAYLVKPFNSEDVIKKSMAVLKAAL